MKIQDSISSVEEEKLASDELIDKLFPEKNE
jgi:hypothetical protein